MSNHTTENFACPKCKANLPASTEYINCKVRCTHCETKFILSAEHIIAKAPAVVPQPAITQAQAPAQTVVKKKKSALPLAMGLALVGILAAGGYWFTTQQQGLTENSQAESNQTPNEVTLPHPVLQQLESQSISAIEQKLRKRITNLPKGRDFRTQVAAALQDETFQRDLSLHALINKCGVPFFTKIQEKEQGHKFIQALFADTSWQEDIMASGPLQNPQMTVNFLHLIWQHEQAAMQTPLYRQLATCLALEFAERRGSGYQVVSRFRDYVNAHKELRLHSTFDSLEPWEMRLAMEMDGDEKHFAYLLDKYNYQTNRYMGTCWDCQWILNNIFGDSIHGSEYFSPWSHAYSRAELANKVGGVCGTLSHYGTSAARVHGIPAMAAGQPGHCAYIIRDINNRWNVSYSVTWPTAPKNSFWGWTYTHLSLIEDAHSTPEKIIASHRAAWLGDAFNPSLTIKPETCALYPDKKWRALPDLTQHKPTKTVEVQDFNYRKVASRSEWIAVSYKGQIIIPRSGDYKFSLRADDEANFTLHGQNPLSSRIHTSTVITKNLQAGSHPFTLNFLEITGGDQLQLTVEPTQLDPRVLQSYQYALECSPLNYTLWREYKNLLIRSNASTQERLAFCKKASNALNQHQEAAWQLINDSRLFKDTTPGERFTSLVDCHSLLQQKNVARFIDYPYDRILNEQKKILGNDKNITFQLFKKILKIQENSDRYFVRTLDWGRNQFAKDNNYKDSFSKFITQLASNSESAGKFKAIFKSNILDAERTRDKESFHRFASAAEKMLKLDSNTPIAPFRDIPRFPGYLLSAKGVPKISSTSRWDEVFRHRAVIGNRNRGGLFHTNKENKPHIEIQLEGKGLLSGITIVNTTFQSARQVPLKVEVSTDRKNWTQVFYTKKNKRFWKINLEGKNIKALHVRVSADRAPNTKDYFHLHGVFVYGKKLF